MKLMAAVMTIAVCFGGAARAGNELVLLRNGDALNGRDVAASGSANRLHLLQDHPGEGEANHVSIKIEGDGNGGPLGSAFFGAALESGLVPGELVQRGMGNALDLAIEGSGNLFAAAQVGNQNVIAAVVVGSANQASISQFGNGNLVGFSQAGIGNTVSVTQTSW